MTAVEILASRTKMHSKHCATKDFAMLGTNERSLILATAKRPMGQMAPMQSFLGRNYSSGVPGRLCLVKPPQPCDPRVVCAIFPYIVCIGNAGSRCAPLLVVAR
jgi:hypothetical protein